MPYKYKAELLDESGSVTQTRRYRLLREMCADLNVHRSSVHYHISGQTKSRRKSPHCQRRFYRETAPDSAPVPAVVSTALR